MAMRPKPTRWLLAISVAWAMAACSEDERPAASPRASEHTAALEELASAAGSAAAEMPTLLTVVNDTGREVTLTSADGRQTASIQAGKPLRFGSQRVCAWLPLTATAPDGRVIAEYDEPCDGQTWTISAK